MRLLVLLTAVQAAEVARWKDWSQCMTGPKMDTKTVAVTGGEGDDFKPGDNLKIVLNGVYNSNTTFETGDFQLRLYQEGKEFDVFRESGLLENVLTFPGPKIKLKEQLSRSKCKKGESFGKESATAIWVDKGCRGTFSCNFGELE